ncbi:MAG: helix-turn-helix transcriptional regulator [Bacilli bacterium]|nr:helix-turn-helix transcriptional regulator [Bacilli bacterium]
MIVAYDEQYLDDVMKNLGEAMDYAVNYCKIDIDSFMDLFISTEFAEKIEKGIPKYVSGISGTELVMEVFLKANSMSEFPRCQIEYDYSQEYWCGWILAYYQWYTRRSFKEIKKYITMKEIVKLYPTLHEASEMKFIDTLNAIIRKKTFSTHLQLQRKIRGFSQRELAEKVGISVRTLQQYEIRAKDINKAAGITLLLLSNVLGCRIEDLLEYDD